MRCYWLSLAIGLMLCIEAVRAETLAARPALDEAKPLASCKLQTLPERNQNSMPREAVLYTLQPPPEEPLDNYERTPLGDWRMPATVDRDDPWERLLLLGPKRPVVIDLAVFIDGRPFRSSREAWIDELLKSAPGNNVEAADGTKRAGVASETVSLNDKQAIAVDQEKTKDPEPTTDRKQEDVKVEKTAASEDDKAEGSVDRKDTKDEDGQEAEKKDKEKEDAKPAESPGIKAQYRQAPTMTDRLQSYLAAADGAVDRAEIRWLIAEWGSGPPVLLLGPSLSWQRAGIAPLLAYLDREQDGGLSATEIGAANDLLRRADIDANDVLDSSELRRAAARPAAMPFYTDHSLLVALDAQTDWDALAATMGRVYRQNAAGATSDAGRVRELMTGPADVTLRVDFGTAEKPANGISLVAVSERLGEAGKVVTTTNDVVTLDLGADYIEFSAAQRKDGGKADVSGTQVAVGAAIDGNPLLRLLDRDNDHRVTMRERQDLSGMLSALDRDGDRTVSANEMPMPIRFAVTLGPHVHELLATPVGAARAITPRDAAPTAPAWFTSMDKNHDGDLSRSEFLGNSEQFRQIDGDGDGLVSIAEAVKLKPGQ